MPHGGSRNEFGMTEGCSSDRAVLLRKQESRATNAAPTHLGSCVRRNTAHRLSGRCSANRLRIVVAATPASPMAWLIWSSPFTTSPAANSPGTLVRW